jgi:hypothetical protein
MFCVKSRTGAGAAIESGNSYRLAENYREKSTGKQREKKFFIIFFISPLFLFSSLYNDLLNSIGRLLTNNEIGPC